MSEKKKFNWKIALISWGCLMLFLIVVYGIWLYMEVDYHAEVSKGQVAVDIARPETFPSEPRWIQLTGGYWPREIAIYQYKREARPGPGGFVNCYLYPLRAPTDSANDEVRAVIVTQDPNGYSLKVSQYENLDAYQRFTLEGYTNPVLIYVSPGDLPEAFAEASYPNSSTVPPIRLAESVFVVEPDDQSPQDMYDQKKEMFTGIAVSIVLLAFIMAAIIGKLSAVKKIG